MRAREMWLAGLRGELERRHAEHLLRALRQVEEVGAAGSEGGGGAEVEIDGKRYVQFCTNNYLGLAQDSEVIHAAREATAHWGTGAGASRLVSGSLAIHHELEAALAKLKGTEAALVLPTGYMANLAVVTTFGGEGDGIVSDKLNHASLLDAAGFSGAVCRTFPHRQYGRAEELLGRMEGGKRFLVTDGVFSMDGDVADLRAACDVAERAGALVVVDDAHGTGVLGSRGAGTAEMQGVEERIDVTVGTLSKVLGSVGGFVAGPREAIEMLVNAARSFIFTTALPAGCAAAALASLRIVEREPQRRKRVMALAEHVRTELRAAGLDCGDSVTPIVPLILGNAERAIEASERLKQQGLYVPAIRPPTVAPNASRLRVSLMATHSDSQVEQLIAALKALGPGCAA